MIDFHTHPLLVREIIGDNPELLKVTRKIFDIGNNLQPLDIFFLEMDVSEIEKAVLLPIDCRRSKGLPILSNEIIGKLCKENSRFMGFASVDPIDKDASKNLEEDVKKWNLKGLKLSPATQDFSPTDKEYAYPVYEKASSLNLPILFHMGMSWEPGTKITPGYPMLLEEVAYDFPNLNIVIAHFGWPWVVETAALSLKYKNVYIDTSALYFDSPKEFIYFAMNRQIPVTLIERSLRDKIVFGSNYPRVEIKNMANAIRSLGLSEGCLELIFKENAEKLLNI